MNAWGIFQLLINFSLIAVGFAFYVRSRRPRKDDPRLSKGLQLLQSKIAILEDLSDRVDHQVKQLTSILDQKAKMTHESAEMIQEHLNQVEKSIQKSLEVSKIFQDKIPHKEIIERQNTIKYIQAARMAHQGMSVDEIARAVDVPRSELEFIAKVNKDRLMFSEKDLPTWALNGTEIKKSDSISSEPRRDMTSVYEGLVLDRDIETENKKIESEFKETIHAESEKNEFESYTPKNFSDDEHLSHSEESNFLNENSDLNNVVRAEMVQSLEGSAELKSEPISSGDEESQVSPQFPKEVKSLKSEEDFLDKSSMDFPIIQKLGSIVESKLGFKVNVANESASREKNKQKTVKPFVFTRID